MSLAIALAAATASCSLPPGWDEIDAKRPRFIIFGEMHGTAEAPAIVGQIACALAARRERVLVAVEQKAGDDAALQAAWTQTPAAFAQALPATLHWHGRLDGNASLAIRDLLVGLHDLKTRGEPIAIVAFDGEREPGQRERFANLPGQGANEAMEADNIRRAADAGRYDRILILVGNLHAAKEPVARGGVRFEPMATRLDATENVISLGMVDGGGTAWACQLKPGVTLEPSKPLPPGAMDCRSHPQRAVFEMGPAPRAALGKPPSDQPLPFAYDGYIWLGPITASPPVAPKR